MIEDIEVRRVGPDEAAAVLDVVREAFADRPPLDPPADALSETEESLAALLAGHGGLLALADGKPAGALVLDPQGDAMYLRRFGVLPSARGRGVASVLVDAAVLAAEHAGEHGAHPCSELRVVAREELPATVQFWQRQGFVEVARRTPNVELRRPLGPLFSAPDAERMRDLGRRLAGLLRAGDLVVLSGELGAGKTTFTQGLGDGLGVRGGVTSPTFVIARIHPSEVGGPDLVHVDAYRIGGIEELDDLDLDASLEDAVTVVEWGTGLAEELAESRLEVRIERSSDVPDEGEDPRTVLITPVGARWRGVSWESLR